MLVLKTVHARKSVFVLIYLNSKYDFFFFFGKKRESEKTGMMNVIKIAFGDDWMQQFITNHLHLTAYKIDNLMKFTWFLAGYIKLIKVLLGLSILTSADRLGSESSVGGRIFKIMSLWLYKLSTLSVIILAPAFI